MNTTVLRTCAASLFLGLALCATAPAGEVIIFSYDAGGRLKSAEYEQYKVKVNYHYDRSGNILQRTTTVIDQKLSRALQRPTLPPWRRLLGNRSLMA